MANRRRKAAPIVVDTYSEAGGKLGTRAVTYQAEMVRCGKAGCSQLHGPYWYAYWRSAQRALFGPSKLCKRYIGKEWRRLRPDEAKRAEAPLGNRKAKGK